VSSSGLVNLVVGTRHQVRVAAADHVRERAGGHEARRQWKWYDWPCQSYSLAQGASGVTEIFRERVAVGVYFIRGHTLSASGRSQLSVGMRQDWRMGQ